MTRLYHAYLPPTCLTPLGQLDKAPPPTSLYHVPTPPTSTQPRGDTPTSIAEVPQGFPRVSLSHPPPEPSSTRRSQRRRTSASHLSTTQLLPGWEPSNSHQSSLNTTFTLSGQTAPSDSLTNLPRWTLPLSKLTPLASLIQTSTNPLRRRTRQSLPESDERRRVSVVCCVMTVESPVEFRKRNQGAGWATGWRASWQVSARAPGERKRDNTPVSCDVQLWDDCARDWGGSVRKGDVVLLQDVTFSPASATAGPRITLSPSGGHVPSPVILYRTLPRYTAVAADYIYRDGARGAEEHGERGELNSEDRALRPDLRLSDPSHRLVATEAQWCAEWVGGESPQV